MPIGRRKRIALDIILVVIFTIAVTTGINFLVRTNVMDRAERNVQNLILSHRGLHHYIQEVMHPAYYKAMADGSISPSYYASEMLSSSYVVRVMHGFYNQELKMHDRQEIYYKLASENPRNPVNKADPFEASLIDLFNKRRDLKNYRQVIKLDGRNYLYYAIPFLENTEACLRCHGKRGNAPPGLQVRYGGEAGFNEKVGHIRAIESIRAPLGSDLVPIYTASAVVGATALSLIGLYLFGLRLRSEVQSKTERLQEELTARRNAENELRIQTQMLEEEIDERKKIQEKLHLAKEDAEAANRAKTAFLANMSHELRTPLTGVIGYADLLTYTETTDTQKSYIDVLKLSADNLLALLSDVLDITQIEAEQLTLANAECSLGECLDEVVMTQQPLITEKGLAFKICVQENMPDRLVGDRLRVKQILSNLLANAIKFTEKGSITIAAAIKEQHESTILLDLSVSDTGIGIEPELMEYIFEMFTQADDSSTRSYGGTGLGLAISRKLAELMGGSITVESKVNEGSTFHLLLPCKLPSSCTAEPPAAIAFEQPTASPSRPLSILVAEDDPTNLKYICILLRKLGHRVAVATDGKRALETWESGNYDLVMMDIQMPAMSGEEVARSIRQRESGTHVPIIAITAHAIIGNRERFLEAGFDGYLAKPFRVGALATVIKQFAGNSLSSELVD
jgi:signal transduction histidine kinase/ActR/RegA family two-component response regulator